MVPPIGVCVSYPFQPFLSDCATLRREQIVILNYHEVASLRSRWHRRDFCHCEESLGDLAISARINQ